VEGLRGQEVERSNVLSFELTEISILNFEFSILSRRRARGGHSSITTLEHGQTVGEAETAGAAENPKSEIRNPKSEIPNSRSVTLPS
jgi:hypothetical protein